MRKENRVITTYVDSLIKGLQDAKKKLKNCEPHEILEILEETIENDEVLRQTDRVSDFLDKIRWKQQKKKGEE